MAPGGREKGGREKEKNRRLGLQCRCHCPSYPTHIIDVNLNHPAACVSDTTARRDLIVEKKAGRPPNGVRRVGDIPVDPALKSVVHAQVVSKNNLRLDSAIQPEVFAYSAGLDRYTEQEKKTCRNNQFFHVPLLFPVFLQDVFTEPLDLEV